MTDLDKISQFATAMLNAATLDDLLWSIAENIGTTLEFDDCVVYLNLNGTLVQKAAFGIKNPEERSLLCEIEIPVGQGIVGAVAQSKIPEIVQDVSLDKRYIWDQFAGKSELTIPIVYENKTLGIIDSESSKSNNYSQNDKELLQIIANIAAPRIASAQYCSQLQHAQFQLKTTNIELASSLNELKDNQEALIQSEKMASIGLLSAGVAHEINNPLGFSISNLSVFTDYYEQIKEMHHMLLQHPELPQALRTRLSSNEYEQIVQDIGDIAVETTDGLLRIKNIVTDLCGYARNADLHLTPIDINESIKVVLNLLRGEIQNKYYLKLNLIQLPMLAVNQGKIHQVIMNILLNALQATPNGGVISIKTSFNSSYVCIDITDNGSEINNEELALLFTPFYTTKSVGEGTGLGLFICYRIVTEEHGGKIQVYSSKKETTFRIMLPLTEESIYSIKQSYQPLTMIK